MDTSRRPDRLAALQKRYTHGTHRVVPPEATLARIAPLLGTFGITRCADVTGLDRLGIPVYCAIRPEGRFLQVTQGKGLTPAAARASALMEAVEFFHCENPDPGVFRRASYSAVRASSAVVRPDVFTDFKSPTYFTDDFVIDWVAAEHLSTGVAVWVPGSAVHVCAPQLFILSTNGLASGNHPIEATLHALYELLERDSVSRVNRRFKKSGRFVDLATVDDEAVAALVERAALAAFKVVLVWVPSVVPVHTFMAVLLDQNPVGAFSTVAEGYGTHLSPAVAASRAITEAAQNRLSFIHGAREDMRRTYFEDPSARAYRYFDAIAGDAPWSSFTDHASDDLRVDCADLVARLASAGYQSYRVDLTHPVHQVPVVKVLIPGLSFAREVF